MGFKNTEVMYLCYVDHDGNSNNSGKSAQDAKPIADGQTLFSLPAGFVATEAGFVVTEAITGTTAIDIGDATDADGLVANGDITYETIGAYVGAGAYVASDAHKYYAAETDVLFASTGVSTDGKGVVFVKGYQL